MAVLRALRVFFLATACAGEETDTSSEPLDALLAAPHDCALEEAIHQPGEQLDDCYRRTVWSPGCQYETPDLDSSALIATIATYDWGTGPVFTITDQQTLDAFVASIPFSDAVAPQVDFDSLFVAGIFDARSSCEGNSVETGIYLGFTRPQVYYRFHDVTGTCAVQCDALSEVVLLFAMPRDSGFPAFCVDQLDSCNL